jgi:hypothetical protein
MSFLFSKKISKIFFILGFLSCFPFVAQAADCASLSGSCLAPTSCASLVSGADPCPDGFVCCTSEGIIPTTPVSTDYEEGSTGGFFLLKGHLVPCGRQTDDSNTTNNETKSCTLCHLFILLKNIFDLMLSLIIIVAILMITIGGVIYIVSTGNPALTGIAKNIINKTLIGFALMLVGWLLVFTLLTFLSSTGSMLGTSPSSWFSFTCDETSLFDSAHGAALPSPGAAAALNTPNNYDYTYQTGIASQLPDASASLINFLNCMKPKLATEAKLISSISDSYGITNCLPTTYSSDCAHTKNSCHYGGRNTSCIGKSYAVDFANESYQSQINNAALSCNPSAYVLLESNHVHVSIGAVSGCGCN